VKITLRLAVPACLLFISGAATAATSNPLDTLAPMTWFEVPSSAVATSGEMYQYPAGTYFGNTTNIRFFDESGASYDDLHNRMIVFGGGHSDYAGNEIMTFDISALKWIRLNDPSPRFDTTGVIERSGYYPDANGNPDPQQPRSRHSYWSQIYVPTIDRYCAIGAFGTFPQGLAAPHVDCFDFATKSWSQKADAPNAGGLLTATFDPATNRIWVMGNRANSTGFLAEWDAVTDTWTKRTTNSSGVNDRSGPLLDTKRRRLVFLGGGAVRMFDLTQPGMLTSQLLTLQGDTEIANRDRPGFAYDTVNDKYVAYSGVEGGGTRDIYVIDPDTWTSTRTTLAGAVAPAIPASVDTGGWFNGIYGRLAYIPTKNAFIFINNHIKDSVFFFKLSSAGGAALASSLNPSFGGEAVTFLANVTGSAPAGTVTFTDNGVTIPGCAGLALSGLGDTRGADCATSALAAGSHSIEAAYSGDSVNSPSIAALTQVVVSTAPGVATILNNPYGPVNVQGATLSGNAISNFSQNSVIQLGPSGGAGPMVITFDSLNLGPGAVLNIRPGAAGQVVMLVNNDANPALIAGILSGENFLSVDPPLLSVKSPGGITIRPGAAIANYTGIDLDTLGATWFDGNALVNDGAIDSGVGLTVAASKVTGGGEFSGDDITFHTYGNIHNPVNGAHFLDNGILLKSGQTPPTSVALTINAYGTAPQALNFHLLGNATVWMPSQWPSTLAWPVNNAVVDPGQSRPPGISDPGYGGGSMIVQAEGSLALSDGGTRDFVFPGGIVLKSNVSIDLLGVAMNQGWTTSGKSFQGVFLEAPVIESSVGTFDVFGNDLNWINFSTLPSTPVRTFDLFRNADGSASFAPANATAPHLNTYSVLSETAANGGCWTCLVDTQPVYVGP
jgi:hypothetical protein